MMKRFFNSITKLLKPAQGLKKSGFALWAILVLSLQLFHMISAPKHELLHFARSHSDQVQLDITQADCGECLIQHAPATSDGTPDPDRILFPAIWTRLALWEQRRAIENRRPVLQSRAPPFATSLNS